MKELNQPVLEAVTEAANEAAAEYQTVLGRTLGMPFSPVLHERLVGLLFQFGYQAHTGEWPGCDLCGADDHAEYACPNSR